MHPAAPEEQHKWLQQLIGEWSYEGSMQTEEGESSCGSGTETVRPLGELWVVAEGQGTMPGGAPANSLLTFGYDPQRGKFIGTWIGSMMTHLWVYDNGTLDAAGRVLSLECDGPSFNDEERAQGKLARYRDAIELKSPDHRVLTASVRNSDGTWNTFMKTEYRRTK